MKKLIIVAVAAMLGIAANAANVNWKVQILADSPDNKATTGWLAEIYTSDVTFTIADRLGGKITAAASTTSAAGSTGFKIDGTGTLTQDNNTSKSYYVVVFDGTITSAKNYIVSSTMTANANAAGSDVNLSFGSMKVSVSANKFLNSSWESIPIPEPTSALMLLLGVAGLALRRKQA